MYCKGITKLGKRCKNKLSNKRSKYCNLHKKNKIKKGGVKTGIKDLNRYIASFGDYKTTANLARVNKEVRSDTKELHKELKEFKKFRPLLKQDLYKTDLIDNLMNEIIDKKLLNNSNFKDYLLQNKSMRLKQNLEDWLNVNNNTEIKKFYKSL